jgi:3-dehydroquinate dehydratase
MTGHTAKAIREIPHHLTRITLLMVDTIKTKLLPAIRPICHHQSIRHSRSLREELSYMATKANGDEVMTLATETSLHDGKLVEMVDPSKGNKLDMMTHTAATTRISIALPTATMTKGKAPTAVIITRKIQLHIEQREAIAVAETHRRTSKARGVTPHHPHQEAPMAVAVAAQPGRAAPKISVGSQTL